VPYELGVRTGVSSVDAVILAIERADVDQLVALLHPFKWPCGSGDSVSGLLACPPGLAPGSLQDVIAVGECQGFFLPIASQGLRDRVARFVSGIDARVHAIAIQKTSIDESVPGKYLIVFADGHALNVDDTGITVITSLCGQIEDLFAQNGTYLLPPK
jgi:hypothetical protein